MKVSANITKNSYEIVVDGRPFKIAYPKEITLEPSSSKPIVQNIAFSQTWFFGFKERVNYDFNPVFFKDFILKTCSNDMPTIAEENNFDTNKFIKRYKDSIKNLCFKEGSDKKKQQTFQHLPFNDLFSEDDKAVLLMSFGKDSLLSFGLAEELGLNTAVFFNSDTIGYEYELNKRKELAKEFQKEFKTAIYNIDDYTDLILDSKAEKYLQDFQGSALVLYYSLLALPVCYKERARYIIVGNEQNFNDPFTNKDGFESYVTADQTSLFMKEADNLLKKFTEKNNQLISLIEPIYNLFEMKILCSRYPSLLKYIISCSNENLKQGHWCYKCPMCAKAFLFSVAVNSNPERMNFKNNFFSREYEHLYPLFNSNINRIYEKPARVRDEQLLAFYLAYKNKAKGYLMEKFKKRYLKEAEERHEELYKLFFGIHPSTTLPSKLKEGAISIYREELSKI